MAAALRLLRRSLLKQNYLFLRGTAKRAQGLRPYRGYFFSKNSPYSRFSGTSSRYFPVVNGLPLHFDYLFGFPLTHVKRVGDDAGAGFEFGQQFWVAVVC